MIIIDSRILLVCDICTAIFSYFLGRSMGKSCSLSNAADHAIAVMDGESLSDHVEWLVAMADARARKEKRK